MENLPKFVSTENAYVNIDNWQQKYVLFIYGMPGSGKSTLAKEMETKYGAVSVSVDFLNCTNFVSSTEELKKHCTRADDFILAYMKEKNLYKGWMNKVCHSFEDMLVQYNKYIEWVVSKATSEKKYIIIEGIQCNKFLLNNKDFPIIFMGTSKWKSYYRKTVRDLFRYAGVKSYKQFKRSLEIYDLIFNQVNEVRKVY